MRKINKGAMMGQAHDPVRRTFLPWTEPLLGSAARLLSARYRTNGFLDLTDVLLVVPGARAGRRLLELLAETAGEAGSALRPPQHPILTPGSLPEFLYDGSAFSRPFASGASSRRAWSLALSRIPPGTLARVFPDPSLYSGLGGRSTLARLLDSMNRTLGAGGRTFADVAAEAGKGDLFSDLERWEALSRIQEVFWRILEDEGLLDREVARRLAVRDKLVSAPGKIFLIGATEIPGILREMLHLIPEEVEAFIHAPQELGDHFDSLGMVRPEAWARRSVPVSDADLILTDRPGDQASAVLQGLVDLEGAYPPDDITVGVPDRGVVPFLEQRFGAYDIPFRYAGGFPVSRTGPYRFLTAAAGYLAEGSFQTVAELIRHPVFQEHPGRVPSPERLDTLFSRHLPGHLPYGEPSRATGPQPVTSALEALHGADMLGGFHGTKPISAWMVDILDLLARVFGRKELDRQKPDHRKRMDSALAIRERAQSLHDLPPGLDEGTSAAEAIRILLTELEGDTLPPEALEGAVEMVGWLELHLDDASALFLTGVNEGTLPESLDVDPFLPNSLRAPLGLPDNRFRFARDIYLLTAILHSREGRVRVISGRRDSGGNPLRPSRLLLLGEGATLASRVLRFAGEGSTGTSELFPEPLGFPPAPTSGFHLPPEPVIPVPEIPRPLPVTAFRSLLSDPFRWALERVLGLEEISDEAQELDPLAFGNLAHRVLEAFGRSPEARAEDAEAIRGRLDTILEDISRETFGSSPLPSVPLQVTQLRARLHAFAEWQAQWVREGWRIRGVEVRTIPEGAPFQVDETPIFLSGRIDRIDIHEETGAWAVFDYKTGDTTEPPRKTHQDRNGWKDLQLPLYRHLIPYLAQEDLPPWKPGEGKSPDLQLAYLPLTRKSGVFIPAFADWTPEELRDADETARTVIRTLRANRAVRFEEGPGAGMARGSLASLLGRGALQGDAKKGDEDMEGGEG